MKGDPFDTVGCIECFADHRETGVGECPGEPGEVQGRRRAALHFEEMARTQNEIGPVLGAMLHYGLADALLQPRAFPVLPRSANEDHPGFFRKSVQTELEGENEGKPSQLLLMGKDAVLIDDPCSERPVDFLNV